MLALPVEATDEPEAVRAKAIIVAMMNTDKHANPFLFMPIQLL
jgi:hypothetical protein